VAGDTDTIKQQMAGVTSLVAPGGTTISAYVTQLAHELAA
jgi:hypothetical protein